MLALLLLDVAAATLPELPWRGEGVIDVRWNLGLPPDDGDRKERKHPLAAAVGGAVSVGGLPEVPPRPPTSAKLLKLCYYCAK